MKEVTEEIENIELIENQQEESNIIIENLSLMGILRYLEEKHVQKKSGNAFLIQDIEGYILRGNIPQYLGGHLIVKTENPYNKLYKLVKNTENGEIQS